MIYLGADHRGYELKEKIKQWLVEWGYQYQDLGNTVYDGEDDYPDFAEKVGREVGRGQRGEKGKKGKNRGILVCGTGIGMDIVANKFSGVRCGLGFSTEQVKRGRQEDGVNCLALPADFVTEEKASEIVKVFLETKFFGKEKYKRRIGKISNF